jgi:antitoxin ParD1/3/4
LGGNAATFLTRRRQVVRSECGAIAGVVETGDYSTTSEVIRDALRLWKREREAHVERLRRLSEEELASGHPVEGGFDSADFIRRGRERLAARQKAAE